MSNSWLQTGERIRKCRTEKNLSQTGLATNIAYITGEPIKRQTVGGWENGKPVKKLEQLMAMCTLFSCDMSYLLCECDTKRIQDGISDRLGLTKNAIDILISANLNKNGAKETINTVTSRMIENKNILLDIVSAALSNYETGYYTNIIQGQPPMLIEEKVLYNAEKDAVFLELMRLIDTIRKENDLPPFKM